MVGFIDHSLDLFFRLHLHAFFIQVVVNRYGVEPFQSQRKYVSVIHARAFLYQLCLLFFLICVNLLENFHSVIGFSPLIKFLKVPVHVFFLSDGIERMNQAVKFGWRLWL